MIIPVAALIALLTPVLLGGSALQMARLRFRHGAWIAIALGVQILIIEVLTGPTAVLAAAHVATYLVAAWFLVANRRIPGLWLIGLGALANGLAITVNSGTLPARAGALRAAGLVVDQPGFVNSGVVAHPHLAWLGDVFALPAPLPLANVFSVGDLLIVLGVAVASWRICGTRWTRSWTPPRERAAHRADRPPRLGRHAADRHLTVRRPAKVTNSPIRPVMADGA
jgi:hypothetical protein